MPFKIVRNDITKMNTEAIVNTANQFSIVGDGCDTAVYEAAGFDDLLKYREANIGEVPEGEAFITPGFKLPAKYIIHTVSPLFRNGRCGEEEKLRSCYRNSLRTAKDHGISSIAFPLISTGSFGYPKEEGLRIAIDEITNFLLGNSMDVQLVVFDADSTNLGEKLYPDLEKYIDENYVEEQSESEYGVAPIESAPCYFGAAPNASAPCYFDAAPMMSTSSEAKPKSKIGKLLSPFEMKHGSKLDERMTHIADTFSEYLLYLIKSKNMENAEVYNRAIVDKKLFSKIKNNPNYHPQKITALCLCVGAKLNLDETKDLLARAGYALSPCDKRDVIFSYFIENEIYDMIELDLQLEEHDLPCLIS